MKKSLLIAAAGAIALVAASCASAPKPETVPVATNLPKFEIVEHKGMTMGVANAPDWVVAAISNGNAGVEAMSQYKDKYCFVADQTGNNLQALQLWAQGFSVNQEIARMVSNRVQSKFVGAAAGSPQDEFGQYFENVVKAAADATFSGVRKEADWWVKVRYFQADGKKVDREEYRYLVLMTVDKASLQKQIDDVIDGVATDKPLTKTQQTAVDRVKESFYEGF